jgi:hypothetical protein
MNERLDELVRGVLVTVERKPWIMRRADELPEQEGIMSLIRAAAVASDVIWKLSAFLRAIGLVADFIKQAAPPDLVWAEDDALPTSLAAFITAKPDFVVANYAYLKEFDLTDVGMHPAPAVARLQAVASAALDGQLLDELLPEFA